MFQDNKSTSLHTKARWIGRIMAILNMIFVYNYFGIEMIVMLIVFNVSTNLMQVR